MQSTSFQYLRFIPLLAAHDVTLVNYRNILLFCRYFEDEEVTRCETFVPALPFTASDNIGSLELQGDRVTNLGTNL